MGLHYLSEAIILKNELGLQALLLRPTALPLPSGPYLLKLDADCG